MIGLILSAIVLSGLGALAQRGAASLLGVRARLVLGTGPRIGPRDREPGAIELRPIPLWIWTAIADAGAPLGRTIGALAVGPVTMVLVPFVVLVIAVSARGAEDPDPGPPLIVGQVEDGSPADTAGIVPGDVVIAVEHTETPNLAALIAAVRDRGGRATRMTIEHEGARREIDIVPFALEDRAVLGLRARSERRDVGLGDAIGLAAGSVRALWSSLISSGEVDREAISGPVGLAAPRSGRELDDATRIALVAMAWSAVAPLWALLMALGAGLEIARRSAS
ncbi:MAG: PDZ domain-containing protein [Myxococcota bacterium]|nr:PDZ domain-containing protein [Myxococcota bacterium]